MKKATHNNGAIVFCFPHFRFLLMNRCWDENPDNRPTFEDIVKNLSQQLEESAVRINETCSPLRLSIQNAHYEIMTCCLIHIQLVLLNLALHSA